MIVIRRDRLPLIVREPLLVQMGWFLGGFLLGFIAFFVGAILFL